MISILGDIYYGIGILITFSLLTIIFKYWKLVTIIEWMDKYQKVIGKKPTRTDFRNDDEYFIFNKFMSITSLESIWILFGIISGNWYIFLVLLLFSYLFNYFINLTKYSLFYKLSTLSFLIFKFFVYLYLIINHFHLHYNTYNLIIGLFI